MTNPGPVVLATTGYLPASTEPVATTRYLPASKPNPGSYWVPTRINCIGVSLRCSAGIAPVIQEIDRGGLAENAGLLVGDSILSVFTAPSPDSNMVSKIEVVGIESDQLTHLLQAGATSGRVILQVSRTRGGTEDVFLTEIITIKPPLPIPPSHLTNLSARPHLSENDAEFEGDPAFAFPSPKGRDKRRADEDAEERGNLSLLAEKDAAYATRQADELEKKAKELREKADKLAKLASEHRKDEIYEEIARLSLPNATRDHSAFSARRTQMLNITADAIPVIPVDPRVKHLQKVVDYSKDEAVKGFMRRNRWLSLSVADTGSLSSKVLRLNWVVSSLSISIVVSVIVLILSVAESEVV